MSPRIILRLCATLVLVLLYQPGLSSQVKGQSTNVLEGDWLLTTVTDRSGRNVSFKKGRTGIVGTYTTANGEPKEIRNIRVSRGVFYFEVPDLRFYFQMKQTRDGFQGTVSAYSATQKRVPEPAWMKKRINSRR
jgi:hypothetical protein